MKRIIHFLYRTFNKENLAKTSSNITQDLMSIARMMEGQVKQSEADMQILGVFKNEQHLSTLQPLRGLPLFGITQSKIYKSLLRSKN